MSDIFEKNTQCEKQKYVGAMPRDMLCKTANQGVPFIFLGADWLYPQDGDKDCGLLTVVPRQFPLRMDAYLVFNC